MPQKVYGLGVSVEQLTDASAIGTELLSAETSEEALNAVGAASAEHTHAQTDIDGLQESLDAKASVTHNHDASVLVSGTINEARVPALSQSKVTGLTDALNQKIDNVSGQTMRIRGYGVTFPTTGNQTGDIWFLQG